MKSSYERAHYYEVVGKEPVTLSFSQMLRFCHEFQASHYSEHLWMAQNISEYAEVDPVSFNPTKWSNTLK